MNSKEIRQIALTELQAEQFRKAVDEVKEKLKRPWWIRLFPWRVTIKIERK